MKKILFILVGFVFLSITIPALAKSENASDNSNKSCTIIQSGELLTSDGRMITTGFDEWGYNYQGRFFNGGYCDAYRDASWCQPYINDSLLMKWNDAWLSNKDCDGDELLDRHYGYNSYIGSGAWLTNHQSGDYNVWSIIGDWVLDFTYGSRHYIHNMSIVDDSFSGTGIAQFPPNQEWTVEGSIDGNNVDMIIKYNNSTYKVHVLGTIEDNGIMGGNWSSNTGQSGIWVSTRGLATNQKYSWNYFTKIVAAPSDATLIDGVWYSADGEEIGPVIWGEFATILEIYNDQGTGEHGVLYKSPVGPGFGKF